MTLPGFEPYFGNQIEHATAHAFLLIRFAGRELGSKEFIYVKPRESPLVDLDFGGILETRAIEIGAIARHSVQAVWSIFALPGGADPQQLSMLSINPSTAALLFSDLRRLETGRLGDPERRQFRVGRSVIAIAKSRSLRTVSLGRRAQLVDGGLAQV